MNAAPRELAVIRFAGETTAVERYAQARDAVPRTASTPPWTRDVGFVERHHNGRLLLRGTFAGHYLDIDEGDLVSRRGVGKGAAAGGLIGVLAGPPGIAVGLVLGGLVGSHLATPDEVEAEPEAFVARVKEAVPPSSSAIVMIAPAARVDEMVGALGAEAARSLRRPLTDEESAAIESSLADAPTTGSDGERRR